MLIVFVFAAVIAIMLYRELPVVLFEAKRQKEQLLIDRGHEYVRAIQLFYRRNRGQYPASIEQLENTNNVRFLRRRYNDPFTGKDDWRLLHAGPGGMLIDSQVNRGLLGVAGAGGPNESTGTNGPAGMNGASRAQNGFSNFGPNATAGGSGFNSSASSTPDMVVPEVPQRAPAVQATNTGTSPVTPSSGDLAQNPDTPLLPPSSDGGASNTGITAPPMASSGSTAAGAGGQPNPMRLMNPVLTSPTATNPALQASAFAQPGAQSPIGAQSSFGPSSLGRMGGGALAGVASKAGGHSIKVVEDQRDYSKWEFYYDPTKDRGVSGASQSGTGTPGNVPSGSFGNQQNGVVQNNAAQGSPANGSTFSASPGGVMGQPPQGGRAGQQQQPSQTQDPGAAPDAQQDPVLQQPEPQ